MVKRKSSAKFNYMLLVVLFFAILMIVSYFLHFVSFRQETIIGDRDFPYSASNILSGEFPQDSEDGLQVFGNVALRLGVLTALVGGVALIILVAVSFFLPKVKAIVKVEKVVSLVVAVIAIVALIGALVVANRTAVSYGTIYDFQLVLDVGIYMYVVSIGVCVSSMFVK
ncbi:MAG TPA: hypothetical protein P5087_06620 [Eubacteriales bacterium]|nr:hypothetical protein [Eubacteriales bacterium]